jgi:hypothetical protein
MTQIPLLVGIYGGTFLSVILLLNVINLLRFKGRFNILIDLIKNYKKAVYFGYDKINGRRTPLYFIETDYRLLCIKTDDIWEKILVFEYSDENIYKEDWGFSGYPMLYTSHKEQITIADDMPISFEKYIRRMVQNHLTLLNKETNPIDNEFFYSEMERLYTNKKRQLKINKIMENK